MLSPTGVSMPVPESMPRAGILASRGGGANLGQLPHRWAAYITIKRHTTTIAVGTSDSRKCPATAAHTPTIALRYRSTADLVNLLVNVCYPDSIP
jgi:hypothetical protein